MVLKKSKPDNTTLFIDASKECIKVTNNNKLTAENIEHIVDYFMAREVIDIAKLNAEIEEIVARENVLRCEIQKIIAEIEG